jgi:hypothetical protein
MPFLDGFEVRNFIDTHPLPARIKEAYSVTPQSELDFQAA